MQSSASLLDSLAREVSALTEALEARTGRDRAALVRRYRGRPVAFAKDVLRVSLTPQQEAVIRALGTHPLVVVPGAVGVGKDHVATCQAMYWAYIERALVIFQAPTERQANTILMGEVRRHFHRAVELPGEVLQRLLRIPGASHAGILSMTSTESSRLTGFHAPDVRVVLSEAQGLEDHAWEAALSVAVGPRDRILAVNNPLRAEGRFYTACLDGSGWHRVRLSALDHPNVLTGRDVVAGAITRRGVEQFKQEYGETSGIYRARILAEFPLEAESALIPRPLLERALSLSLPATPNPAVIAGVDTARSKSGSAIGIAVGRGGELVHLATFHCADTVLAARRVLEELAPFEPNVIRIDVGGPGAGIADILRRTPSPGWHAVVEDVHFGGAPMDRARFPNRRAELWFGLRERLEREEVALPRHRELLEELAAPGFGYDRANRIVVEAKDEVMKRLGRGLDRADAVVMALGALPARPWRVWHCPI
jgi:hypothetical protein